MKSGEAAFTIRSAQQEDFEQIAQIERLSFPDNPWDITALSKYDCVIAEIENEIAGFLISRQLVPGDGDGSEREILNIAVHPQWRRLGIGRSLLLHELRRGGTFFLEVRESNQQARKLYESLSFAEVGKRPEYYSSPAESAIVMQRKW